MTSGAFIAIEGIDGAGVTTQSRRLQQRLEEKLSLGAGAANGSRTHRTKEPTDGPAGGPLRLALAERLDLDPRTLALLFAADRSDHVERTIEPLLEAGTVVITDRYELSSYAYQLEGVDGDLEWLRRINEKSVSPDLTIVLDVDVDISHRRRRERVTDELFETDETLETVRDTYLQVADELQSAGHAVEIVDAGGDIDNVADRVFECVAGCLESKGIVSSSAELIGE